ncbi:MAG TPA: bifunctional glutamine amidotransferase/anthranilate phosphoribosyltransferase, partial [Nitrospirota bacterium]|nr:bifunctional glutamine amidotransferase/anthranilate phosphoribosyltransferase [Nitrospirota bacterium]
FNVLGPLTNPAGVTSQIMGVYAEDLTGSLARALGNLGAHHAFVVHGMDGLDEITITDRTRVSEFVNGSVKDYFIHPSDFGLPTGAKDDLRGGDAKQNAEITISVLKGKKGVQRDIVLLNAAAGLAAAGRAKDLKDGMGIAAEAIDSGAAIDKLEQMKAFTNKT